MLLFNINKNRTLQTTERLQTKLRERKNITNKNKLNLLKSILQNPLFNQILNLQTSVQQLKKQIKRNSPKTNFYYIT